MRRESCLTSNPSNSIHYETGSIMKPHNDYSGTSAKFRIGLVFGILGCVAVNISQAGFVLLKIGEQTSRQEGEIMFLLALTLIYGSILAGKTLGNLFARNAPVALCLLGILAVLGISVFSISTTAVSISSGATESVTQQAAESDRVVMLKAQITDAQATVSSLQAQADAYPRLWVTKKRQTVEEKRAAQAEVAVLDEKLQAAMAEGSSIGQSLTGVESTLGITDIKTKAGFFIGVLIEILQAFLVISYGYLTGGRKDSAPVTMEHTAPKKPRAQPHLRAV